MSSIDMMQKVSPELIKKSFVACGQSKSGTPEEIHCLLNNPLLDEV